MFKERERSLATQIPRRHGGIGEGDNISTSLFALALEARRLIGLIV